MTEHANCRCTYRPILFDPCGCWHWSGRYAYVNASFDTRRSVRVLVMNPPTTGGESATKMRSEFRVAYTFAAGIKTPTETVIHVPQW